MLNAKMDIQRKAPDLSIDEITVVLLGDFNPKIFHPMWFANHGVLREAEATEATIEVVHSDVCSFSSSAACIFSLKLMYRSRYC